MASFLNKLKSTVSEVLPGNPLSGDYEIQDKVVGSAGPGLVWKIYRANKKTTKENASVFVFDKKTIDKLSRDDKKLVIGSLRRGIQQLTKLRHPKILSVVHPIEENRDCLAFATEPVLQSLANALETDVEGNSVPLDELEIKYGLIQVLEALSFLHNDVKLVHGNIHPSSIILNDVRCWKLSGFDFSLANSSQAADRPSFDAKEWCSALPQCSQPDLDYLAPEHGSRGYCDTKSDMYSLGVAVHAMHNQGKPIYQCHDSLASFKTLSAEMQSFRSSLLRNIPAGFHESFKSLLSYNSTSRPGAKTVLKTGHFEDMALMTLVYLDSLVQRDNLQKSQYFKNLPSTLKQLPLNLCLHRVLPVLFSECANKDMIPFVLQNIVVVAEKCSKQQYQNLIFNRLIPIFSIAQPIQIPLLLLKNMPLLLSKTAERDTKSYILPMLFTSIELQNQQLQELCLDILPDFSQLIDKLSMKNSVIPRIKKLCMTTQYLNLRVKCLISIGKMVTHMDKWFVLDEVLPFLPEVPSREPAILMAILGIHKIVFTHKDLGIPKDQLATKCLPFLVFLSVDHSLSKQQFISYMSVIKEMLSTVEREHLSKLKELELQEKDESSLKFNGEKSADEKMMQGFLSEAGLLGGGATSVSATPLSKAAAAANTKPTATAKPQVKDLTAMLPTSSMHPMKPAVTSTNASSTITSTKQLPGLQSQQPLWPSTPAVSTSSTGLATQPTRSNHSLLQPMSVTKPAKVTAASPSNLSTLGNVAFAGQPSSLNAMMSQQQQRPTAGVMPPTRPSTAASNMAWGAQPTAANVNSGWSFNSTNYLPQQPAYSGTPLLGTTQGSTTTTGTLTQNDIQDLLG